MTTHDKFRAIITEAGYTEAEFKQNLGIGLTTDNVGSYHPQLVHLYPACPVSDTPLLVDVLGVAGEEYGNALLMAMHRGTALANALGIMDPHDVGAILAEDN